MRVLIIDRHDETRDKVRAIVRAHYPETEILFAATGNDAVNHIISEAPLHAIITSNRLDGLTGANLLQAIWRTGDIPTLLHSAEAEGYIEVGGRVRKKVDLAEHASLFDFATFKIKDFDLSYIKEFLIKVGDNQCFSSP